jgi:hypothetical protein
MPNPVPAIIEALGAHMGGWAPESGTELADFMNSLPELLEKLHETLGSAFSDLAEARRITEPVIDASDGMLTFLREAQEGASETATAFSRVSEFWL